MNGTDRRLKLFSMCRGKVQAMSEGVVLTVVE